MDIAVKVLQAILMNFNYELVNDIMESGQQEASEISAARADMSTLVAVIEDKIQYGTDQE